MSHLTKAQRRAQKRGRLKVKREREVWHGVAHDFVKWVKMWWASDPDDILAEMKR